MSDITVKFRDGTTHTYSGAPDDTTQVQVLSRVLKDYPDRADGVSGIEGARPSGLGERLKSFATEGQFGPHGVFSSDLPQLLLGVGDSLSFGGTSDLSPPQTDAEKKSRSMGRFLPMAVRGPVFPSISGKSLGFVPAIPTAAQLEKAKAAGEVPKSIADQIMSSPVFKQIAKAAGIGGSGFGGYELVKWLASHLP